MEHILQATGEEACLRGETYCQRRCSHKPDQEPPLSAYHHTSIIFHHEDVASTSSGINVLNFTIFHFRVIQ